MINALGQSIPFVHPSLALLAAAAGVIPIVIHLINRRRFRLVRWAAMTFLLAARQKSRRRVRLQNWLLMAARILAIALLGLAVARPYLPATAMVASRLAKTHHVFLIDNSLSMTAVSEKETTPFQAARQWALERLMAIPETDSVSLITMAAPAEAVIGHEAYDRRVLRDQFAAVAPTERATDVVGALDHAVRVLRASSAARGNRVVYLISDYPESVWKPQEGGAPREAVVAARRLADEDAVARARLVFVQANHDGPMRNLAVTRLAPVSRLVIRDIPASLAVDVTNFGVTTVREAVLHVSRDGEVIRREPVPPVEPGATVSTIVSLAIDEPGTHTVEATVKQGTSDALSGDDVRYLSVDVRDKFRVLLLDGRPGPTLLSGEAGFVKTALSSAAAPAVRMTDRHDELDARGTASPIEVRVITVPELDAEPLAAYDVVGLCGVSRLDRSQWERIEEFVSGGGGLLVFAGDLVDPAHYNEFGYRAGAGLLPARLARSVRESKDETGFARFSPQGLTHPIVLEFADQPDSGLFLARINRYLPAETVSPSATIVARYTNGDAGVIAGQFGDGKVVYLSSSANMSWNNLAAKGDFVSLMFRTVSFLARPRGAHRTVLVGQGLTEPLSPAEQSMTLRVARHGHPVVVPRIAPDAGGFALSLAPIEEAGLYRADIGSAHRWFAVNVDTMESELRDIGAKALARAVGDEVQIVSTADRTGLSPARVRTFELAFPALVIASILLLAELWMALRFDAQQIDRAGSKRVW